MNSRLPVKSYIWDITNPNTPEHEITPSSPLCCLRFNPKVGCRMRVPWCGVTSAVIVELAVVEANVFCVLCMVGADTRAACGRKLQRNGVVL